MKIKRYIIDLLKSILLIIWKYDILKFIGYSETCRLGKIHVLKCKYYKRRKAKAWWYEYISQEVRIQNETQRRYKEENNKNKKRNHDKASKYTMLVVFYFIIWVTIIHMCTCEKSSSNDL